MQRTIVVKGTGKVSLKPDRIELDLRMRALDKEYRASMEKGALYLSDLREKLKEAGFDTDDLKTTNFNVERYSEYDSKKREYRFVGYYTNHSLRLGFDFDTELLSKALDAVSNSVGGFAVSVWSLKPFRTSTRLAPVPYSVEPFMSSAF